KSVFDPAPAFLLIARPGVHRPTRPSKSRPGIGSQPQVDAPLIAIVHSSISRRSAAGSPLPSVARLAVDRSPSVAQLADTRLPLCDQSVTVRRTLCPYVVRPALRVGRGPLRLNACYTRRHVAQP